MKNQTFWIIALIIFGFWACDENQTSKNTDNQTAQNTLQTTNNEQETNETSTLTAPEEETEQEGTDEQVTQEAAEEVEKKVEKPKKPKRTEPAPKTEKEETKTEKPAPKTQPKKPTKKPVPPKKETKKELPKVTERPKIDAKPFKKTTTKSESKPAKKPVKSPTSASVSHTIWDGLLRANVSSSGKVNYAAIKRQEATLDSYLALLAANPIKSSWTRNEKMTYWINAYNAFTVKLIVKNYPVGSITDLHGGKPWDKKWIKLGTKTYSLNNIENDILRPKYKDARIHFAVNCAAKSCPKIHNRAWTPNNLNTLFQRQTKAFINNTAHNKISANSIKISKIFEWYKGDFGNIIDYLNKYSITKINKDAKVEYLEYNWQLNK